MGFSQIGTESAWRVRNTESILEAARAEGIQVVYDDAQQKQENQLKALRSFIVYQVDVIAFVPIVEDGWDNILREAKDAGIPVIIVDRKIVTSDENLYDAYIGEDGLEEGRKAAQFLVKKFGKEKRSFNIMQVHGTQNSSVEKERTAGFNEIIRKEKKFTIVNDSYGDFIRSRGKEIMDTLIKQNGSFSCNGKKIDIIFSQNDSMTLGILDSLEENGIAPGSDVTVVSIDAEQKSIDALKEKKLNCVVECNPNLGPDLIMLVKRLANLKGVPKVTYITESVFTENDDFSEIEPRGY
ncbi:MAG: ABC transporter substrate-binding protein [Treponema sp.]|nr:ABC transporter substrate-binding protein [Treponema sp.]